MISVGAVNMAGYGEHGEHDHSRTRSSIWTTRLHSVLFGTVTGTPSRFMFTLGALAFFSARTDCHRLEPATLLQSDGYFHNYDLQQFLFTIFFCLSMFNLSHSFIYLFFFKPVLFLEEPASRDALSSVVTHMAIHII